MATPWFRAEKPPTPQFGPRGLAMRRAEWVDPPADPVVYGDATGVELEAAGRPRGLPDEAGWITAQAVIANDVPDDGRRKA